MTTFVDRRVLILGGSSGVGLAAAKAFDAAGAQVTIASRSQERLDQALGSLGRRTQASQLDIRHDQAVELFFQNAGAFDHVVLSAAATPFGSVAGLPLDDAYEAMNSKFWGSYRVARAVSIAAEGSLTFVSGYLSQRPGKAAALQSAINAALEALARGLAMERAPIRVNTVSPGLLRTALWDHLPEERRQAMYDAATARLPVGRVGLAEDIATAILFLAANRYTTGTTVFVDGGGLIA